MTKNGKNEGNYAKLGVSHSKEEVHDAIKNIDKGLFPNAFCKILPDISGDPEYCSIFHSDSAGTKTSLAYMMYKETGDLNYFRGVVRDAIVMNVDDVLCVGVIGNALISDTIGRNKKVISGEALAVLIDEHVKFTKQLTEWGFGINLAGGETEDIGDLIRTFEVGVSLFARTRRKDIITGDLIGDGDVIIGLASSGKASYEEKYNSGMGSNGLTLARHGSLSHEYFNKYPECRDSNLEEDIAFFGKYKLLEPLEGTPLTIGEALLSPTRTYAPIMVKIIKQFSGMIHGIFHNTGGGQTKCLHFGQNIRYIKDSLMKTPPLFQMIQSSSNTSWREMYQVFNMGHRMEIIVPESISSEIINISNSFGVDAQIIGHIEKKTDLGGKNYVYLKSEHGEFEYSS